MVANPRDGDVPSWIELLQDAVLRHDREQLDDRVSDRMIWVLPDRDNARGKLEWIDASCSVEWEWFEAEVLREVDLGEVRLAEVWMRQSRRSTEADGPHPPATVAAEGVVVDAWALEGDRWRLVVRHPQRAGG